MGLGKCTGRPFHDLDPRSRLWHRLAKICLSVRWNENHSSDHYKTWQLYWPSHGYYLIRFWRSSVGNLYFGKFSLKILDVFFQGQTLFWTYLRNGWSDWCKRKGSASVGYWAQYVTLTFDLTHNLDLGCFKVKFWNSSFSGIVGLINVKWKRSELIWYWADCMTLPFDHTHDLDLGVEIWRSEIALYQEWDGWLTWNEKGVGYPFMTMILTSVTVVGWEDVPDSDWGDFRRRRAVDISNFFSCIMQQSLLGCHASCLCSIVIS